MQRSHVYYVDPKDILKRSQKKKKKKKICIRDSNKSAES